MRTNVNKLYLTGVICGSMSLCIAPWILGLIGIIIGAVLISKDALFRGIHIIILSMIFASIGYIVAYARIASGNNSFDIISYIFLGIAILSIIINSFLVYLNRK